MTSAMESPRRFFAELSPITQRTASITLDLPQPLGPTMPTRLLGSGTVVGSTKDLTPDNLIFFSRIASLLNVKFHTGLHGRARIRYLIRPFVTECLAMPSHSSKELETFANPYPGRAYSIRIRVPEFTCLCPKTCQPEFATLFIDYVPNERCVELKSLKLYVWSFRDEGAFHEAVTNRILDDLLGATAPRFMRLTAEFGVRGGIYTNVIAEHRDPNWTPPAPVHLP